MDAPTAAIEDYAKAIYALQRRTGGGGVATNDLAERLGVTAASVSAMVKKLHERGLVEHSAEHLPVAQHLADRQRPRDADVGVRVGDAPLVLV